MGGDPVRFSGVEGEDRLDHPVLLRIGEIRVERNRQDLLPYHLGHRQPGGVGPEDAEQMIGVVVDVGVDALAIEVTVELVPASALDDGVVGGGEGSIGRGVLQR